MTTTQELLHGLTLAAPGRTRLVAALALHAVSHLLGRLAAWLLRDGGRTEADPVLEFYAQSGAPEGALYVDGQLVGTLHGVTRL